MQMFSSFFVALLVFAVGVRCQSISQPTARIWQPGELGKINFDDTHTEGSYKPPQHVLDDLNGDRGALEAILRALGLSYRKNVDSVCEFSLFDKQIRNYLNVG